jgi:alpha-galactosidase
MLPPTRRSVIKASTAALLLTPAFAAADAAAMPIAATLFTESGARPLARSGNHWQAPGIDLTTEPAEHSPALRLRTPTENPLRLHVRWATILPNDVRLLGDAWERSYGDLAFRGMEPERILPWYVLATDGRVIHAFGVRTAPAALCFWQVDPQGISLWCDLRNGGRAVELGDRELNIGEVVAVTYSNQTPFQAAQHFCGLLSPNPRLLKAPIYGGNNWYYAYGHSSASDILQDSERIASVSDSKSNRPWMVIDDGWAPNPTAGPWRTGNASFPDMPKLAADMRRVGVRPALWTRPLFTRETIPNSARLRPCTLDPTHPQAAAQIQEDLRTVISWGYQMVKHDFSTYDLLGRWGFQMNAEITDPDWSFYSRTRTNAEIIRDFYKLLRDAAGETPLLGCNTIGHLSAGLFEAQRIGDDTSGRDWNRTRKMGVNTLAFRMPQHNTFFAVDADCVGLTTHIDWKLNRQWLDLLARSGTPLFVSIAPDAFGAEQRAAVREAFNRASHIQTVAEPLNWLNENEPQHWTAEGRRLDYDWFGNAGASPFSR